MPIGRVTRFNTNRGYGFIRPDDGTKDVYVEITAFERAGLYLLDERQRISFDVRRDSVGRRSAVNLHAAR